MLQGGDRNPHPQRVPGRAIAKAIRGLAPFVELAPELSGARDFADTAAIIAGLEHVVTVDTSVAHLAGSLGTPTSILMSRPAVDWYVNWKEERSAWYPSARIVRQRSPGDWAGVIADLAPTLNALT